MGASPKSGKRLSERLSPIADQSRDLSLERLGRTWWASANPRAEVAQDQLAPRLLDPPSAEVAHSLFVLAALDTSEMVSKVHRTGRPGGFKYDCSRVLLQPSTPYSHAFEEFYCGFLKRTNRAVGFGERGMPP